MPDVFRTWPMRQRAAAGFALGGLVAVAATFVLEFLLSYLSPSS